MQKIQTLQEITNEVYGETAPFRELSTQAKLVIVKIQRNNIEIARLELKELKNKRG